MPTENPLDDLSPLERARRAMAERRAAGETIRHLSPIQKAIAKPKSRTLAIAANCYACQGGSADSGVKWRIGNCTVGPLQENESGCALYGLRPYQHLCGKPTPALLARGRLDGNPVETDGESAEDDAEDEEDIAGDPGE
ncbi:hypothetical protein BMS3Bbin13_00097 [bacterium BMS3Bbin13]|nr:hypothetical protein BMS3Bbin13_00097 [bacterium BMS3Bbin13]